MTADDLAALARAAILDGEPATRELRAMIAAPSTGAGNRARAARALARIEAAIERRRNARP